MSHAHGQVRGGTAAMVKSGLSGIPGLSLVSRSRDRIDNSNLALIDPHHNWYLLCARLDMPTLYYISCGPPAAAEFD